MAGDFKRLLEEFQAKPLYDEEEAKAAQAADRQQARGARVRESLGGVSDALTAAFTRTPVAPMRSLTVLPSAADALASRQRGAGMEQDRRLRIAEAGHRVETDEGKRQALASVLPDVGRAYGLPDDVLSRLSPDNMVAVLGAQGAKLARDQAAKRASAEAAEKARERAFRAGENEKDRASRERAAGLGAGARTAALEGRREQQLSERNVGGFSIAPGAAPSPDSAKKVRDVAIAEGNVLRSLDRLEQLYKQNGTEAYGDVASEMEGEWKNITDQVRNISNMGVPNANDYTMLAMQVPNPVTWKPAGVSGVGPKFDLVRRQMQGIVDDTARASGYRRQGTSAPQGGSFETGAPAGSMEASGMEASFSSGEVLMQAPNGLTYHVAADEVADAENNKWRRLE